MIDALYELPCRACQESSQAIKARRACACTTRFPDLSVTAMSSTSNPGGNPLAGSQSALVSVMLTENEYKLLRALLKAVERNLEADDGKRRFK